METSSLSLQTLALDRQPEEALAPILGPLSDEDKQFLLEHAKPRHYRRHNCVVREGDDADFLYYIQQGEVEVYTQNRDELTLLRRMCAGEFFGELAVLVGGPRMASVATLTDTKLLLLPKQDFIHRLYERPSLLMSLIPKLINLIRDLTQKVGIHALDAYGRIRFYLNNLSVDKDGERVIEGHWTQTHFAHLANCKRETAAKILKHLENGGWIRCERDCLPRRIVILKALPERF